MAKKLNFLLNGTAYAAEPTKVERKKVYGWTEIRAKSSNEEICRQVSLDANGTTIVPKGATKLGMLRSDGNWMEKDELVTLHVDGTSASIVPSSFDGDILLDKRVDEQYLLDHTISSVYQLSGDDAEALSKALGEDMYAFEFNYRADYKGESAILLSNGTTPFVFVGEKALFDFIGLEENSVIDEPDDELEEEVEDLDFSMF